MKLRSLFGHLKTVCIHKWYVFKYCCKFGIPWQGITHDLSKFSPTEFFESTKYWTGTNSPINNCKAEHNDFCKAWIHHRGRNLHHYEAWTDNYDGGKPIAHMMPWKYVLEMVADYIAAGITYAHGAGKEFTFADEFDWWVNSKSDTCLMHEKTKEAVFSILYDLTICDKPGIQNRDIDTIFKIIRNGAIKKEYIRFYNEYYNL